MPHISEPYRGSIHTGLWRLLVRLAAVLIVILPQTALAAQPIHIIRDAQIETMIKRFADPLLKAAGLQRLRNVYLVDDRRFNAFVDGSGSMFVNYGTILDVKRPNELKAIIAHEIGHVADGHLNRLKTQANATGGLTAVATILGIGAAIAASQSGGGPELTGLATAFVNASQSVGTNSLMAFRRGEESAADAAALKLLARTGQSGKGLVDVLKYLQSRETPASNPYLLTHPIASDRLTQVEKKARASKYWGRGDSARDIQELALAQAKLSGYLEPQSTVLNRYPNSNKSQAARYARVISAYKSGSVAAALPAMASLAASAPQNPYFQESLGQMYFEAGKPVQALPALKKAVALAPEESEIRLLYGQALLTAGGKANLEEAVLQLTRAVREKPKSATAASQLSRAYALLGNQGAADLYAAEAALDAGNKGTALGLAQKAKGELPQGSPLWLRADDILSLK